ncbi:8-amino-7-oxononanoate synthase [Meredithblackwellia eburnea MCA 4105]
MGGILEERLSRALSARKEKQTKRTLSPSRHPQLISSNLVDFSSNDYLSFAQSPILKRKLLTTLSKPSARPLGPSSSRLLDGNTPAHLALESELADFLRAEAGLLFNSGFDANAGLWACLPSKDDFIVYDALIHASTHDGMRASRVLPQRRIPFKHNSVADLQEILLRLKEEQAIRSGVACVWVAVETLYSMDGDLAPLAELVEAVETILDRGNGHMVVDEAHSTGLYGPQGRGVVCALSLANRITIRVHTFGKAMSCSGAVVLSNPLIRSYLVNYARPLIYSTTMPNMNIVAIQKSFEMLQEGYGDKAANKVHSLATLLLETLSQFITPTSTPISLPSILPSSVSTVSPSSACLDCQPSHQHQLQSTSPIIPLLTPEPAELARFLIGKGFLVRPITYPTVPRGEERVRVCLHAGNTEKEVLSLANFVKEWIEIKEEEKLNQPSTIAGSAIAGGRKLALQAKL